MTTYSDYFGVVHVATAPDMETNCGQGRVLRPAGSDVPTCLRCIGIQLAREQFPMVMVALKAKFPDILGR